MRKLIFPRWICIIFKLPFVLLQEMNERNLDHNLPKEPPWAFVSTDSEPRHVVAIIGKFPMAGFIRSLNTSDVAVAVKFITFLGVRYEGRNADDGTLGKYCAIGESQVLGNSSFIYNLIRF